MHRAEFRWLYGSALAAAIESRLWVIRVGNLTANTLENAFERMRFRRGDA